MDFLHKVEDILHDMKSELHKVRTARLDSEHHINFITNEINQAIRSEANDHPDSPARSLGAALTKLPSIIRKSFEYLDKVESNIVVTITAYEKAADIYTSCENEKKQSASISGKSEKSSKKRKIGSRPENKLKDREHEHEDKVEIKSREKNKKTKRKKKET